MELEERVKLVEEVILIMRNLVLRHDERLDDYDQKFRESREDFDFKLNALIDAQIKNEADLLILKESTSELRDASRELSKASRELSKASRSQLTRIEILENR